MTYIAKPDNHEAYPEGYNLVDGRFHEVIFARNVLNSVVPEVPAVSKKLATRENVETALRFVPNETVVDEHVVSQDVLDNAQAVTSAGLLSQESQEAAMVAKAAREIAKDLAESTEKGLENVSKANQ